MITKLLMSFMSLETSLHPSKPLYNLESTSDTCSHYHQEQLTIPCRLFNHYLHQDMNSIISLGGQVNWVTPYCCNWPHRYQRLRDGYLTCSFTSSLELNMCKQLRSVCPHAFLIPLCTASILHCYY